MARKSLKKTHQIDGRIDDEQRKRINELLHFGSGHGYGNITADKYEESLDEMNLADLHNEAIKHGLQAHQNRTVLIKNLIREFKIQTSPFKNYSSELEPFTARQKKRLEKLMK